MKKFLTLLMALSMCLSLAACGGSSEETAETPDSGETAGEEGAVSSGVEDGVLTIAMECAYAPYNWTQNDDANGAVEIRGSSDYAYGYDVMMAKKIGEALGQKVQIVKLDWDSLIPAVMSGDVDCVIAGQSITRRSAPRRSISATRTTMPPSSP